MKCPRAMLGAVALGFLSMTDGSPTGRPERIEKKEGISSCGNLQMASNDVSIAGGGDTRKGFNTAVDDFCAQADGKVVEAGGYLSLATEVYANAGKDPAQYGVIGYVYFEVHNKLSDQDHTVESEACKGYLKKLSESGAKCYGEKFQDTKGGTWQVGKEEISYHALPFRVPPKEDALNKLWTDGAINRQSVNKRQGSPLNPMPLDSHKDVKPVTCHSHNDYDREVPLFQALAAGCVSIEADVWYINDNQVDIGHALPTLGRSLRSHYIEPLREILDHNNEGADGNVGIFKAKPDQSFTLLVDFKTKNTKTLDAVVSSLEPLREKGYLSYVDGDQFVERQITIVASGSAPFDRIASGDGIPDRDVLYDAHADNLGGQDYSTLNSYYASADYANVDQSAIEQQVAKAHEIGLKVRYWGLPNEDIWEDLMGQGVDRLNADDMSNTARLPRLE